MLAALSKTYTPKTCKQGSDVGGSISALFCVVDACRCLNNVGCERLTDLEQGVRHVREGLFDDILLMFNGLPRSKR